jgi:hypothetical protein
MYKEKRLKIAPTAAKDSRKAYSAYFAAESDRPLTDIYMHACLPMGQTFTPPPPLFTLSIYLINPFS